MNLRLPYSSFARLLLLSALCIGALMIGGCEDDPILAPGGGKKPTGGSYGNIAIAPPGDSTVMRAPDTVPPITRTKNPTIF
jgi:hypothetical protein